VSTSRRFLVDTSAWIETLRTSGDPAVRARISALTADGDVVLCDQVRLELWNGARRPADHRLLRNLEQQLETVPTSPEVWMLACDYARAARGQGLTLPPADLLIAACANYHGLGLIHLDGHFEQLAKITAKPA
jgi:predicted nucleic acid-binding protein